MKFSHVLATFSITRSHAPGIFALSSTNRRADRYGLSFRCSFVCYYLRSRGFLRRRSGRSLLISCKNSRNSGGPSRTAGPWGGLARRFRPVPALQNQVDGPRRRPLVRQLYHSAVLPHKQRPGRIQAGIRPAISGHHACAPFAGGAVAANPADLLLFVIRSNPLERELGQRTALG
jgi:hypothetical protein